MKKFMLSILEFENSKKSSFEIGARMLFFISDFILLVHFLTQPFISGVKKFSLKSQ